MSEFSYSNLLPRPSGRYVTIGGKFIAGIRTVQEQIVPYAEAWQAHNERALQGDAPLWVVLGDSMAQGIGAGSHDRGWVGQLHERLSNAGRHYRLLNLSMSGARMSDVLEHQLPFMESLGVQPALVTVMIGSNDIFNRKYRSRAVETLDQLLAALPTGTIISNVMGYGTVPIIMDAHLQEALQDRQLTMADMRRNGPVSWRGKFSEDRFHPNEAGYAEIARVFADVLGV